MDRRAEEGRGRDDMKGREETRRDKKRSEEKKEKMRIKKRRMVEKTSPSQVGLGREGGGTAGWFTWAKSNMPSNVKYFRCA